MVLASGLFEVVCVRVLAVEGVFARDEDDEVVILWAVEVGMTRSAGEQVSCARILADECGEPLGLGVGPSDEARSHQKERGDDICGEARVSRHVACSWTVSGAAGIS
jgi:hypothetical protein